jgi:hypothetical protein
MGGDGAMPGGMGGGGGADGEVVNISGLEIIGYRVNPDLGGLKFRLGKEFPFPFPLEDTVAASDEEESSSSSSNDKAPAEAEEAEGEGEEAAAAAPQISVNERIEAAMKKAGPDPEQAFEAALRASELFSNNKEYTVLRSYKPAFVNTKTTPDAPKNYGGFVIQVKLNTPVEFYKVIPKSAIGGMGGPGAMPGAGPAGM